MSAQDNKALMQSIYAALERGDREPFGAAMAEDFTWIITGENAWSGTYRGRDAVRRDLLQPLFAQFEGTYRSRATRFIADGDFVVVECQGDVTTVRGEPYHNQYCLVFRIEDGKLKEMREYMDSDLCVRRLTPPPARGV